MPMKESQFLGGQVSTCKSMWSIRVALSKVVGSELLIAPYTIENTIIDCYRFLGLLFLQQNVTIFFNGPGLLF